MKKITQTIYQSFIGTISAGAIVLLSPGASAQNLFVSDYQTGDIYEYTSGGVQSTFATGFSNPGGLAFDSAGDLFVANTGQANIYEFINNGGTLSSTPTLYASGLSGPTAIAFNSSGNMFIANAGANNIIEISGGTQSTFASGLNSPWGLAFSGGTLFAGNEGNNTISEISPGGTPSTFISSGLSQPGLGLTFNNAGVLFVGNLNGYSFGGGSITEITSGGVESTFASGIGNPNQMAFNSAGNLFVASARTDNILEFTSSGALAQTITLSGAEDINGLAFQPVPEPSALTVLALGGMAFIGRRFRKNA